LELGRISSGRGAKLAGMGRAEFLLSLHKVGVAAVNLDEKDLEDDFSHARGE
jgi:predicted HTH domain antitoxin